MTSHLYTQADVRNVEVDGNHRAEQDEAADGVIHKAKAAAQGRIGVHTSGFEERHARVEPDRNHHLENEYIKGGGDRGKGRGVLTTRGSRVTSRTTLSRNSG